MRSLVLLGLTLLQGGSPAREQATALASVRAVELEAPPGTLVQHFRIEDERPPVGAEPRGLMRFVTGPDPEGGLRVELELLYFEPELRLIHTERATDAGRELVFREVRADGGRTLFLHGSPATGYESHELGGREAVRRTQSGAGEFPLFLVEAARRGLALPSAPDLYEPLAARFEPTRAVLVPGEEPALELRRADGSRRWAVRFRAGVPVEWRWLEGAAIARAIAPEEFERLRAQHDTQRRAALAAAARAERPAPR